MVSLIGIDEARIEYDDLDNILDRSLIEYSL